MSVTVNNNPRPMTVLEMGGDEYSAYLRLIRQAFRRLKSLYKEDTSEFQSMHIYAKKFMRTIRALQLKYQHRPSYRAKPAINIANSGFPRFVEIMELMTDLIRKDERLSKLLSEEQAKSDLLEIVMGEPSPDDVAEQLRWEKEKSLLWQIAERSYLELLDLREIFFHFTPGKIFPAEEMLKPRVNGRNVYHFSWACFDSQTNLPYIYLMLFEHEGGEKLLTADNPSVIQLLEVIQEVGGRAPDQLVEIVGRIDETLPNIYPRVLKRNRVGPIYSPLLYQGVSDLDPGSFAGRVGPHFEHAQLHPDDFILFFETEMVVSEGEKVSSSVFSLGRKKGRQVFNIPKTNRDLMRRGSTSVSRHVLLPHRFRQHLSPEVIKILPEFSNGIDFVTYTEKEGEVQRVG